MNNTRADAASILIQVIVQGRSLNAALDEGLPRVVRDDDRAFVQALCYGVLRWYFRLERVLGFLTRKPIKDEPVRILALIGLYQLGYLRVKPHAAVSETVAAAGGKAWAKPLLNGILRNYQRQQPELDSRADADELSATAHPLWLLKQLKRDWPDHYPELLARNNDTPPMVLRIHRGKIRRDIYLEQLASAGKPARASEVSPDALILDTPCQVEALPGFREGLVSVQDTAAQLAALLLDVRPGMRVLDLCAAPGGKTAHILEICPELGEILAVDIAPERMQRVQDNLDRIGLKATLITADASLPDAWWDGRPFDRILLDAPCSATGVIRRHPDIKLLRQASDIQDLRITQQGILNAAWSLLAPGGLLLYATCSVLRAENEQIIGDFLNQHPEAREHPVEAEWGISVRYGRQILAGMDDMDGFYYARLERASS